MRNEQVQVYLVSRPTHVGFSYRRGWVADFSPDGVRYQRLGDFANGQRISLKRVLVATSIRDIESRISHVVANGRKYDLLKWNCETFVEWVVFGNAKSPQIQGLALIAVTTLALVAFG